MAAGAREAGAREATNAVAEESREQKVVRSPTNHKKVRSLLRPHLLAAPCRALSSRISRLFLGRDLKFNLPVILKCRSQHKNPN